MRIHKVITNSDQVNHAGARFTVGSLENALYENWNSGVPNCVGHDRHRVAGWLRPLGIHLQAKLCRSSGLVFLANEPEDQTELSQRSFAHYANWVGRHVDPHIEELTAIIGDAIEGEPERAYADAAALVLPGLATRVAPEIFAQLDDDGLIELQLLTSIAPGVFEYGDGLLLFAHPYFRRSLSRLNTLNSDFLREFESVDSKLNPRIAIDEDMVGLASTFVGSFEFQYWWGPKFDNDLAKVESGVTRHDADETSRIVSGISRTEFRWYGEGDQRSFESEEIVENPVPTLEDDSYGCRFIHSMLDEETSTPNHLDGAIRSYNGDQYLTRIDQTIYEAGRYAQYKKLWRVDGEIEVASWKNLITHYYRDNWLVGEYFGAPLPEFRPEVCSLEVDPIRHAIPYEMNAEQGVQIHCSYHDKNEAANGRERNVQITDALTGADGFSLPFIDAKAIDMFKRLRRKGLQIEVPDVAKIKFGDMVGNLPMICHYGEGAVNAAKSTLDVLAEFATGECEADPDRLLSFTIAIEYEEFEARISIAGHIVSMVKWFSKQGTELPATGKDFGAWIDSSYGLLNGHFRDSLPPDVLHAMLWESGQLVFKREFLGPDVASIEIGDDLPYVVADTRVLETNYPEIFKLLESNKIYIGTAIQIGQSECSVCSQDYETCEHIKILDEEVRVNIKNWIPRVAFWTNRPV